MDDQRDRPFRPLSPSNWMEPDPIIGYLVRVRPDGTEEPATGEFLAEGILAFQLSAAVPGDIRALFEVSRGTMCYGYFFYPLYTIGTQELYRVAEAAIRLRCGANKRDNLVKLINQAIKANILQEDMRPRLDALRVLRNRASHPESQDILMPQDAGRTVKLVGALLNSLFTCDAAQEG